MVTAQFGELTFEISASDAVLFEKMKLIAECETQDKSASSQQYVAAKQGKAMQITFDIILSAAMGADVRGRTEQILSMAQRSAQDYFYIDGGKLFPFKLMLVKAEAEEIQIAPNGNWVFAKLGVTMKQSSKEWITGTPTTSASSSGSSSSGGTAQKATVKTTSPTTAATSIKNTAQNLTPVVDAAKKVGQAAGSVVSKAISSVTSLINKAKSGTSSVSKRATTSKTTTTGTRAPR